jgi:anti-sigma regulatory factor (Ser/Thr protein kinase)
MVRHELGAALGRAGIEESRRYDIALVMTEAAGNAVLHAYPPVGAPGLLFVDAGITGRNLLLRVCDCGLGMTPHRDSPGTGIGLPLISRLADGLEIAPNRTIGGTRVSALFRDVTLDGAPPHSTARRADEEMLRQYVAALEAGAEAGDRELLLAEAQQALGHADHLRSERLL